MQHSSKFLAAILLMWASFANAQGITPVGGGGGGGGGTVTNIATSCGIAGGPITTTGTISGSITSTPQTGANYPIVTGDCGDLINLSNGANQVPIIAQAGTTGFETGWYTTLCNQGAGSQTITPTTSTIGGAATYVLAAGTAAAPKCVGIVSDGTNYQVVPTNAGATTNAADLTSGTLADARMPALTGNCVTAVGTVATNCNSPHPGYIASNWYLPGLSGQVAAGGAGSANIIRCFYGAVSQKITISSLGARTSTAGTNAQFALYDVTSGRPGALIAATGTIDITGATGAKTGALSANKQVGPGGTDGGRAVYFCSNYDNAASVFTSVSNTNTAQSIAMGSATAGNVIGATVAVNGIICSGAACNGGSSTYNTWPSTLAGTTWTDSITATIPLIMFQVNSVP